MKQVILDVIDEAFECDMKEVYLKYNGIRDAEFYYLLKKLKTDEIIELDIRKSLYM